MNPQKMKKLMIVNATEATYKKLDKNTYYKLQVKAYDKDGKLIAKSNVIHVTTAGGNKGNITGVTVSEASVTVSVGKSVTVTSKITGKSKGTTTVYVIAQNGKYRKIKVTVD